jgi:acyl-coenzyme A thioesterase PaaI-like protein
MNGLALNEQYLHGNTCFGCGPANEQGLRIRVFRDGEHIDRLIGTYRPREIHTGVTPIAHGGAQFAALDCMAAWIVFILRADGKMIPLTKSAAMRYTRPALLTDELTLFARVTQEPALRRDLIHAGSGSPAARDPPRDDGGLKRVRE